MLRLPEEQWSAVYRKVTGSLTGDPVVDEWERLERERADAEDDDDG